MRRRLVALLFLTYKFVSFFSIWEEDEKSDGNGMECIVRIRSKESVETYLEKAGSVPIPPYLQREEEMTDKEDYNNAYAANAGSVAAPTAGKTIPFQHTKR